MAVVVWLAPVRAEAWKAGSVMLNLKLGPSIGVLDQPTQGAFVLDLGFALTRNRAFYLLFPFQVQFGSGDAEIGVPFGFQYDIRVARRFYLYPRMTLGYNVIVGGGFDPIHTGMVIPEFGLKYIFAGRFNLGFEPFGLRITFNNQVSMAYRLLFYFGFNI